MSTAVLPSLIGLSYPVERTPVWSTRIQPSVSGKETRINFWSYPLWRYSVTYDVLRSGNVYQELQQLVGFYNARQGSFDSWLFDDPDDNTATAQTFGTGDGVTRTFQLSRTYGGWTEPVKAPRAMSQVTISGTPTTAYAVDTATGLITFTAAPTNGAFLGWTGTYYWRCRFMEDQLTVSKFLRDFWETSSLQFQSIK